MEGRILFTMEDMPKRSSGRKILVVAPLNKHTDKEKLIKIQNNENKIRKPTDKKLNI